MVGIGEARPMTGGRAYPRAIRAFRRLPGARGHDVRPVVRGGDTEQRKERAPKIGENRVVVEQEARLHQTAAVKLAVETHEGTVRHICAKVAVRCDAEHTDDEKKE